MSNAITSSYDVVIVGSGPAGLACLSEVSTRLPGARILLAEGGRDIVSRPCPVDTGYQCAGCAGICNVISGFGGCIHRGDGVKFSRLPSGKRLLDRFGSKANSAMDSVVEFFDAHLGDAAHFDVACSRADIGSRPELENTRLSDYPISVLSEGQVAVMLQSLRMWAGQCAEVATHMRLVAAEKGSDGMYLEFLRKGLRERVWARSLVLATGRAGWKSTERLLSSLGVGFSEAQPSVGIRLELSESRFLHLGTVHPDLKLSTVEENGLKTKTFCFSGGENGGRIKFTHHQDNFARPIISLDGHTTSSRTAKKGLNLAANIGILVQCDQDRLNSMIEAYWANLGGRPAYMSLTDFLDDDLSLAAGDWTVRPHPELEFSPSVTNMQLGDLATLFLPDQLMALRSATRRLLAILDDSKEEGVVVGPEIEFYWNEPQLAGHTKVPDLPVWVAGDALGIAQGILQSGVSGVICGRDLAHRLDADYRVPSHQPIRQPAGHARVTSHIPLVGEGSCAASTSVVRPRR